LSFSLFSSGTIFFLNRNPLDSISNSELNYHRLQDGGFSYPLKRAKGKTKKLKNSPEGFKPQRRQ
jgi:hypothetical protein